MSVHLTRDTKDASHGLVDDRESALHVLSYMSIRYLAHGKADAFGMTELLDMFDEYLEIVEGMAAQTTPANLTRSATVFSARLTTECCTSRRSVPPGPPQPQ